VAGLGKQAKVLSEGQIKAALGVLMERRYPERDRVMVLLSVRAGLRAKEIAMVTWSMVTDAEGNVGDALHLVNGASKGKKGGRVVPLAKELRQALEVLKAARNAPEPSERIIHSERDAGLSPGAVQVWFHRLYALLGFAGASSHSGRRTFVTKCAKNMSQRSPHIRDQVRQEHHRGGRIAQGCAGACRPRVVGDHPAVHPCCRADYRGGAGESLFRIFQNDVRQALESKRPPVVREPVRWSPNCRR
jgi:integrase